MSNSLAPSVAAYDELHMLDNKLTQDWYPKRVVKLSKGGSMLELGLGHGFTTAYFAHQFAPYQVIDGSAEMIARFRERFGMPEVDIVESYFETFDTGRRFDVIAMGFVLEHVDDPGLILRRYRRFLTDGGSLFVAVPNSESLHRRIGQAAGMLPDLEQLSEADLLFGHQHYFSLKTLSNLAVESGYEIVAAEGLMLKPLTTGQLEQLALSPAIQQGLMQVGIGYPELCNSILLHLRVAPGQGD